MDSSSDSSKMSWIRRMDSSTWHGPYQSLPGPPEDHAYSVIGVGEGRDAKRKIPGWGGKPQVWSESPAAEKNKTDILTIDASNLLLRAAGLESLEGSTDDEDVLDQDVLVDASDPFLDLNVICDSAARSFKKQKKSIGKSSIMKGIIEQLATHSKAKDRQTVKQINRLFNPQVMTAGGKTVLRHPDELLPGKSQKPRQQSQANPVSEPVSSRAGSPPLEVPPPPQKYSLVFNTHNRVMLPKDLQSSTSSYRGPPEKLRVICRRKVNQLKAQYSAKQNISQINKAPVIINVRGIKDALQGTKGIKIRLTPSQDQSSGAGQKLFFVPQPRVVHTGILPTKNSSGTPAYIGPTTASPPACPITGAVLPNSSPATHHQYQLKTSSDGFIVAQPMMVKETGMMKGPKSENSEKLALIPIEPDEATKNKISLLSDMSDLLSRWENR